jgi:hypothetical protein
MGSMIYRLYRSHEKLTVIANSIQDKYEFISDENRRLKIKLAMVGTAMDMQSNNNSANTTSGKDARYAKLRALLIRELHPDSCPESNKLEKIVKSELFKLIWPQIEAIDKNRQ